MKINLDNIVEKSFNKRFSNFGLFSNYSHIESYGNGNTDRESMDFYILTVARTNNAGAYLRDYGINCEVGSFTFQCLVMKEYAVDNDLI